MAQQKVVISIPKSYNPKEREALAIELIDTIIDRTLKGKDKKGSNFPGYSTSYKGSLDFKIAGKSKSKVNLQLSGEMLGAIELLNHSSGKITIGFDKDDSINNGKAEGNIKGTYGQKRPIKGKKRDFLGVNSDELTSILEKYPTSKGKDSNLGLLKLLAADSIAGTASDSLLNVEDL